MLNFFLNIKAKKKDIQINEIYPKLKSLYNFDEISEERKIYLSNLIEKYGYLPYPQIKVLEELSAAEVLFGLEIKWKNEGVFDGQRFEDAKTSVLARRDVKNADWIKKEGHDIKLINLAALGNGNVTDEAGKFIDWLRQLLILPVGAPERGIFSTTIYLIPFHPREFGCAYLPTSSDVSGTLEDKRLSDAFGLNEKAQVQIFITMAQLAGHPVIYDVLPQVGRFSKTVLANPSMARWFDIKELQVKVGNCIELVAKELERKFDKDDVEIVKNIYKQGGSGDLSEDYQHIYNEFEQGLNDLKRANSIDMMKKEKQQKIQKKVKEIISQLNGVKANKQISEDDITKQSETACALMNQGLWPAPGGAWCSAGVPVYSRMSDCGSYPLFKHYDYKGEDVTEFANLDCQTPFYFAFLENGQYNKPVIEFFIDYLGKLQSDYNFDGFRVDHVDHVVDDLSERKGAPVSYRIPSKVLQQLNTKMKEKVPYFATMAEYMGEEFFKEYHEDMNFDVLWGNDIPSQSDKTPEQILEDCQNLANFNTKNSQTNKLSILKTYNNQDGEFRVFDRYPGQLGEEGALFKWFKYKFLPGGRDCQRPVLYVDSDESFTKTGIERTIGNEVPMVRENNYEFFAKFDAINRLAKSQELVTEGEAQIIEQEEDGFVSWLISKEPLKTSLLVVANYQSPTEKFVVKSDEGDYTEIREGVDVLDKSITLPGECCVKSEFIFDGESYVEQAFEQDVNILDFEKLTPGEFRIFMLAK